MKMRFYFDIDNILKFVKRLILHVDENTYNAVSIHGLQC